MELEVSAHVHLSSVVHPVHPVLAAGFVGARRLPVHLASAASVSYRRSGRSRRTGSHLPGNNTPVPNLAIQRSVESCVEERPFKGRVGIVKFPGLQPRWLSSLTPPF